MITKKAKKEKIQIGSMVRVISINKSGVVLNKLGRQWLVTFPNETSILCLSSELEINQI